MRFLCWFSQCKWHYLGAFEQADPNFTVGTQGRRGLYQCRRCKTISIGAPTDPEYRYDTYDAAAHQARYP